MSTRAMMLAGLLVLGGCTPTPRVNTDHDPSVDFSRFRTYSWVYTDVPQGMNPFLFQRVKSAVDAHLTGRGYIQASPGDMAIAFTLGARDRVQVTDFGPYAGFYPGWGVGFRHGWARTYSNVDIRSVTDGTLAIDIFDTATKKPIWHGRATQQINRDRVDQAQIDRAVSAALARFPPTSASN